MRISASRARRLALRCQGLDGAWKPPKGKEGAARAVERLGYVQIDTIAVVQRAHHHTFWSRCPDYAPEMLHELQAHDRRVFEYWSHAASFLPMRDYRFYLPRMRSARAAPRTRQFLNDNAQLVKHVIARIRKEGPLGSTDFAAPPGRKRGPWWDWKPAKHALEVLFDVGELMVRERRNFQRRYDLTERVLPADANTTEPDSREAARFMVRRTLAAQGVSALDGWWIRKRKGVSQALGELVDSGEVTPVDIRGRDVKPHYALTEALEQSAERRRGRKPLHILSPFDNLVMKRDRLKTLFDFECKLECYFPAHKRKYGYFCLPILWGDRFVGRLDPKADRRQGTLIVRKLMLEPSFKDHDAVLPAIADRLGAFAAFNECPRIVVEETAPRKTRAPLRRLLRG